MISPRRNGRPSVVAGPEGLMNTAESGAFRAPAGGGRRIVLTAPLTEVIDHAGYFIQMSMASLPIWLEGDPQQEVSEVARRRIQRRRLGAIHAGRRARARSVAAAPIRSRTTSSAAIRRTSTSSSDRTRASSRVSTHNPLGVTFAAGVYTSIFGSSKEPINSHYARELFAAIKGSPLPRPIQVIVGGSGGWQIAQTNSYDELGVDCVVEGRSESEETLDLFDKALRGEALPRQVDVQHPKTRDAILFPDKRTTFGVVEMTTGCGRRCQFCLPDLNPQIDLPKDKIMAAVRANVRDGNKQISLATEDMFIWGQVHTDTPFYFPNREALLDLYSRHRQHAGRRAARAQPRDDCAVGRRSGADQGAVGEAARQEPDPSAAAEHPSAAQGAGPADRPRDRLGADGEADHAEQGRAVSDRGVAERRRAGAGSAQSRTTGFPR